MATEVRHTRRLFTVDEYDRMAETGILARDERVELIDGEIVEMSPIGDAHAACLANLNRLFVVGLAGRAVVWPQGPIRMAPRSKPQPDLALLRPRSYRVAGAATEDVLLVVEVADTSLAFDRARKLGVYARAGLREYWIIDVHGTRVEVYRAPAGGRYMERLALSRDATVAPVAFPDLVIRIVDIFS